MTDPTRR